MTISAQPLISRAPAGAVRFDGAAFWPAIAALTALSLALRQAGLTPDVSWLLDMCQRMLNGETAYVDIFETTPPVPALLYMPGALIANATGIGAGAAVYATVYAAILFALYISDRILPRSLSGAGSSRLVVIAPAAVFLFFLCNDAFAQREHLAAAFALPMACVFISRAETGDWPAFSLCILAAVLAGFCAAIKPPLFITPGVALAVYYLWRHRSIVFLWRSGLVIAGAVFVLLTALSLLAFPAYLDGVAPLMRDIYVPVRSTVLLGLTSKEFIGVTVFLLFALRKKPSPATAVFSVLAAAFTAVYFAQGKYFPYHLYPASFFAGLAFAFSLAETLRSDAGTFAKENRIFAAALAVMTIILAGGVYETYDDRRPRMHDRAWTEGLDRPTALAISTNIAIAFPLAQEIGAVWVDRIHSQWVVLYADAGLEQKDLTAEQQAMFQSYYDAEIDRIMERIRETKPDIIIRGHTFAPLNEEILKRDPHLLDDYASVARQGVIEILKRN
ncbi:hypothetical protein [Hyphococcus sp.]|uniref:hypothetical protein n=1 Tax=Hyphococcus sp. TaxID=2038636 RepID=UPI003D0EA96D